MSAVKTPLEMFYKWEAETPDQVYLRQPKKLVWSEYTWREIGDQIRRIAAFLLAKNYQAGSRIAIWSANSKDWPIVDLAIMLSGHISVPLYPGQDVESACYILEHSESKLIMMGAFDQSARVDEALPETIERVSMLGCQVNCHTSLEDICQQFEPYTESPMPDPQSLFTIVYTSGTTGNPKGVMHIHETPGYVVPGLTEAFKMLDGENRLFSFLPMSHVAERIVVEMCSLYCNAPISFSEGLETFAEEMRSVQPTLFFAVPRLWIKFKAGVDAMIPPEAQASLTDEQNKGIARQLGLAEARIIVTGASPCPRDVQEWFIDKGIFLRDGYGMTENFIHGCGWFMDGRPKSGCVGQPFDGTVQLRISEEGEIQFKSKGLMKGYYLNPEKTDEVFEDGWYKTGDSGRIDEDGNLWVTGRISEVFKTSKGKFVVPTNLENKFGRSELLTQFCVMGHGLDQPVLMATLSEIGQGMAKEDVANQLEQLMMEVNSELPAHEKISLIYITDEWTIENNLLTPTMKIKRKQIEDRYKSGIEVALSAGSVVFADY